MSKTRSKDPNYIRQLGTFRRQMWRARMTHATRSNKGGIYYRMSNGQIIRIKES